MEKIWIGDYLSIRIPVTVFTSDGKSAPGEIEVQSFNQNERNKRALKVMALFWGLSFCSIFLPIAHFILVPGFFIGGPIVALFIRAQASQVLGGKSLCPRCLADLVIVKGPEKWPLEDTCETCFHSITIRKQE